jgi:hypothetical protein
MANMELITSVTVGSGGVASVTLPATGTIPATYTDLKLVMSVRTNNAAAQDNLKVQFNSSTSGYSDRYLFGNGSSTASGSSTTNPGSYFNYAVAATATSDTFSSVEIYIPNYSGSTNKSFSIDSVTEQNATGAVTMMTAGLWSNTNPITTISVAPVDGTSLVEGSTFYLYGISNVTSGSKATGGIVSSDGTYWYHMFPFSGTFTPTTNLTADYLVIAGGGGGGGGIGGGGGAGGLRSTVTATGGNGTLETSLSLTAQSYTVTIGAGGIGGTPTARGSSGDNSTFSTLVTSTGGGGGGAGQSTPSSNGLTGGSAGGQGTFGGGGTPNNAARTASPVQGFDGGSGLVGDASGGGGGAGAVGANAATNVCGNGGNGVAISAFANATQTGVNTFYAGGGGGGAFVGDTPGTGGTGGGANGTATDTVGANGTANLGGGGAGGGYVATGANGGNGGSGLVIIRYAI